MSWWTRTNDSQLGNERGLNDDLKGVLLWVDSLPDKRFNSDGLLANGNDGKIESPVGGCREKTVANRAEGQNEKQYLSI